MTTPWYTIIEPAHLSEISCSYEDQLGCSALVSWGGVSLQAAIAHLHGYPVENLDECLQESSG